MFKKKELKRLSTSNVLKSLTDAGYNELDLCKQYITGFKGINKSVNSDLRYDDKNASLHVKYHHNRLIVSDFGYKTGMSMFTYIQEKYFTHDIHGYMKALDLVKNDFKLDDIQDYYYTSYDKQRFKNKPIKHNLILKETSPIIINIKPRKWSNIDIKFWNMYGLEKKDFNNSNTIIKPLSKFRLINESTNTISEIVLKNNLAYAFCIFYNKKWHYKIYAPLGIDGKGTMKWVSNLNNSVILGKTKPKNNELLIIQSSTKDKVIIDKMGYYSLPLLAEGIWFTKEKWEKLRKYFKKIVLFANNDWEKKNNPGLQLAKKHMQSYEIDGIITTPKIKGVSDISDYTKHFNFDRAKSLVDLLLNKI